MKRLLTWPEYRKQLRDMRRLRSSVWFGWDEIPVTQQAETTYPCERIGAAPQCGNTTGLLRTTRLHREYAMTDDSRCTCPWTDPSTWTYYGDATEPGSQREFDPECPEHGLKPVPLSWADLLDHCSRLHTTRTRPLMPGRAELREDSHALKVLINGNPGRVVPTRMDEPGFYVSFTNWEELWRSDDSLALFRKLVDEGKVVRDDR